jgi:hypothetical protein
MELSDGGIHINTYEPLNDSLSAIMQDIDNARK